MEFWYLANKPDIQRDNTARVLRVYRRVSKGRPELILWVSRINLSTCRVPWIVGGCPPRIAAFRLATQPELAIEGI